MWTINSVINLAQLQQQQSFWVFARTNTICGLIAKLQNSIIKEVDIISYSTRIWMENEGIKSGLVQENIVNFVECALSPCLPINQIPRKSPLIAYRVITPKKF